MAKISVIIPAHQAEDRIRKVCGSVRNQDLVDQSEVELIVVCDRCTDRTEEIARFEFDAVTDIVDFGNDGLTRSRGLDLATGDYVMFIDDDDWWLHEYVLKIVNEVIERAEGKFDMCQFGFIWKTKGYYPSRYNVDPNNRLSLYSNVWTKLFRRDFIGDTRFPNVHSISDSKFMDEICAKNPRVICCDHPIYYYNWLREGSISKKDVDQFGTNMLNEDQMMLAKKEE